MKKLLLALALLAFGFGPALADSPSDANQGGGNDPPSQTGGGPGGPKDGGGQEGNSGV